MNPLLLFGVGAALVAVFSYGVLTSRRQHADRREVFRRSVGSEVRLGYQTAETSVSYVVERRGVVHEAERDSIWLRSTDAVDDTVEEIALDHVRWVRLPSGEEHRW